MTNNMEKWSSICWEIGAKKVVSEVQAEEDPKRWHSFYSILTIRRLLSFKSWTFAWKDRKFNTVAELAAKFSLEKCCNLNVDEFSFEGLPLLAVERLLAEQAAVSL